jgi:hypothetical protein
MGFSHSFGKGALHLPNRIYDGFFPSELCKEVTFPQFCYAVLNYVFFRWFIPQYLMEELPSPFRPGNA